MAKKKITTEEFVGEEKEEKPKDELADSEDRAMEEAVRDFAEGERLVKLYRYQGPLGGRPGLLGGLAREDFNDVYIQERFGGGEYFGRWKNNKGTYSRFNFKIEGEPKALPKLGSEAERANQLEDGEAPYPYLNRPAQQAEPVSDRISMVDVLKMLAETRRESQAEMRMLLELTMARQPVAPQDSTEKVFDLVSKLLPMIQGGGGDSGTGNALVDGFIKLKEPIMKALETAQLAFSRVPVQVVQPAPGAALRPNPAQPVVTEQPHAANPEPQPTVEVLQPTEGEMLAESFKEYLPMFCKAAAQDKDPALYCDIVLDQVPVFAYDRMRTWLLKAGCLDDLAKLAPIISSDRQQRQWWEALRTLIVVAINEELGDAPRNVQPVPNSDATAPGPADSA